MHKCILLCVLVAHISSVVRSERNFHYRNEDINDEKVYFPGKTNEDEVNLKRLKQVLPNSFIQETSSNRLDDDAVSVAHQHAASNRRKSSMLSESGYEITTSSPSSFDINTNAINDNKPKSLLKIIVIENIKNFSEETDELKNKISRMEIQSNKRIPPPSVLDSSSGKSTLRVCEIKYAEYIQRIYPQESDTASDANDEQFDGRVLAAPGEYPHMSAVGIPATNGSMDYICGGSLISEKFVITAAHCTNVTGLQPTTVRIGDLNLMIEESYLEPQIRNIKRIYVHPDYRRNSYYDDIALLELENEVETGSHVFIKRFSSINRICTSRLTEFVRPIRLWTQETLPFTTAYAMGYGATNFARGRTNRLTNLNMTIIPNDECNREMPKFPGTERGILSSQICAKDYVLNRDTCQGDSGGPLQLNIRGRRSKNRLHYQLIGITSYGMYCRSSYPSIYTRVCSYLDWIERIVWKDYFN